MGVSERQWAMRAASFLLVIPGVLLIGVGVGMAVNAVEAGATVGLGGGLAVWGLIVALRKIALPE